jgi:hypothetical protein
VAFDMLNGNVRANALTLHSSTHTLVFRGAVKVHINKVDKAPAAAKPASGAPLVQAPAGPAGAAPASPVTAAEPGATP